VAVRRKMVKGQGNFRDNGIKTSNPGRRGTE
jgi:hypothetical protein